MGTLKIPTYVAYAFVILLFLVIGLFFFAVKDANECLANPFVYGAGKGTTDDSGKMFCTCSFSNQLYAPLYFNDQDISTDRDYIVTNAFPSG